MELDIKPFMGREFCSVILKNNGYVTELGILNCKDRLALASNLLDAVYNLVYDDFKGNHEEYINFVTDNCY